MNHRNAYSTLVNRRNLLRGLGACSVLSPFVPLLNASGQTAAFPKRLVLFYTPHGTIHDAWRPTGAGKTFELGPILKPLERHKAQLNVLDGLDITHSKVTAPPHTEGIGLVWTGSNLSPGNAFKVQNYSIDWVDGPSVDQVIAKKIGDGTGVRSLELGVNSGSNNPVARMIFAGSKQPLQPESNPWRAFDNVFSGFQPSAAGQMAFEAQKSRRKSVLDSVHGQLDVLATRVSAADRPKLEAHLQSVRELERRLQAGRPAECQVPQLGASLGSGSSSQTPQILDRQIDVLAASLACGLTNVGSIQCKVGDNDGAVYSWAGSNGAHHGLSHEPDSNQDARANLIKIYTWYAERFAYLLDRLAAVPEGDGTVLDNTLVVWGSEIGVGNSHTFKGVPFVLAGGAGGAIETGRYLTYGGVPHNRLLVSLCHAFGLSEVTTFGSTDTGSGPLQGFG